MMHCIESVELPFECSAFEHPHLLSRSRVYAEHAVNAFDLFVDT